MRRTPQASRVVERLLSEHDETMSMAQDMAKAAKQAGWNVSVHHDTVAVGRGDVAAVIWYDEGRPVEVKARVDGREQDIQPELAEDPISFLRKITSLGSLPK
jgi:hypothetical protein